MSRYYLTSAAFLSTLFLSFALDGIISVPASWFATLIAGFLTVTTAGALCLSWQFFLPVKLSGKPGSVALTFDASPVPGQADKLLTILAAEGVHAAFFCVGTRIESDRESVAKMVSAGHLVANQTYTNHRLFSFKSSSRILDELARTDEAVRELTGKRPRFFRPPSGLTSPMLATALKRRNYTVVGWTINCPGAPDGQAILRQLEGRTRGGEIVRFTDYNDVTLAVLPQYLRYLRDNGFIVLRLDEMINEKAYV